MYEDHFQFIQEPFSIAPDPSFLFLSDGHNEALAHLLYGFSHGGFVLITGEVGTGKTTLLRNLLDRTPADLDVAFILNPRLTVKELLETICEELGVPLGERKPDSVKQYIDLLNRHLLKTHQQGRSTVVIIDEAQNLSPAVLEQIRLLTNLETNERKLLRIILLGQPELAEMLARTELRQLAQRITARYHLESLSKPDVADYVMHRLAKAGGNPNIFTKAALAALYRVSKGTPRVVNIVADRALLGAYVAGQHQVTPAMVRAAAKEVFGDKRKFSKRYLIVATATVVAAAALMAWAYFSKDKAAPNSPTPLAQVPLAAAPSPRREMPVRTPERETVADEPRPTEVIASLPSEVAPATAAPAKAPDPVKISRPSSTTFESQRNAFSTLFSLWGANYPVDSTSIPCDFAPTVGLQCLRRSGGWSELNSLNAPVVLELWDAESTPFYGALLARIGSRYEVEIGKERLMISPRDLRDAWFGSYVLLWKTPPNYNGSLRRGDRHTNVTWLREKLSELNPENTSIASGSYFGDDLHAAVVQFQREEGLLADGIVGPLTWIRLIDRIGSAGPRLRT